MIKCLHRGSHGDELPRKWHYNITFIYFSGCSLDKIELNVDSNEILDRLSHSSHVLTLCILNISRGIICNDLVNWLNAENISET